MNIYKSIYIYKETKDMMTGEYIYIYIECESKRQDESEYFRRYTEGN